jgi:hypothetical protein
MLPSMGKSLGSLKGEGWAVIPIPYPSLMGGGIEDQLLHLTNPRENRFFSTSSLFHRYHSVQRSKPTQENLPLREPGYNRSRVEGNKHAARARQRHWSSLSSAVEKPRGL